MPGGRQNCIERSTGWWCYYSAAITLCNQHLLHNDTLQQIKLSTASLNNVWSAS